MKESFSRGYRKGYRKGQKLNDTFIGQIFYVLFLIIFFSMPFAWLTHIWVCVAENWAALLIVGLIFFPIGIIHGWGVWFGIF